MCESLMDVIKICNVYSIKLCKYLQSNYLLSSSKSKHVHTVYVDTFDTQSLLFLSLFDTFLVSV